MASGRFAAFLAALLVGCAPGGTPRDEVLRIMGPPTAIYTMPDGHQRLEYSRQPAGRQTFMVDLDAAGRMAHWENVLDENHFNAIPNGLTRDEVLRLIGPPTFTAIYHRPEPGFTWNYRFQTIQRCIVFQLDFNATTGRTQGGAYPSDPGCADEWM